MPLLAALIGNLIAGLVAWLASVIGRKLAIAGAAVAALATITGVLLVAFRAVVNPLLGSLFATSYGQFLGLAFPPVAGTCLAAIGGTWAACALYRWQKSAIAIAVQA